MTAGAAARAVAACGRRAIAARGAAGDGRRRRAQGRARRPAGRAGGAPRRRSRSARPRRAPPRLARCRSARGTPPLRAALPAYRIALGAGALGGLAQVASARSIRHILDLQGDTDAAAPPPMPDPATARLRRVARPSCGLDRWRGCADHGGRASPFVTLSTRRAERSSASPAGSPTRLGEALGGDAPAGTPGRDLVRGGARARAAALPARLDAWEASPVLLAGAGRRARTGARPSVWRACRAASVIACPLRAEIGRALGVADGGVARSAPAAARARTCGRSRW